MPLRISEEDKGSRPASSLSDSSMELPTLPISATHEDSTWDSSIKKINKA